MPSIIIRDTCPAPHFNLTEHEVKECMPELANYLDLFQYLCQFGKMGF